MKVFIGVVTTPNRKDYLDQLLESIERYKDLKNTYHIEVANDLQREGVHAMRNRLLVAAGKLDFDFGFLMDDDIFIKKKNWDNAYYFHARLSECLHLCYYNPNWPNAREGSAAWHTMGCLHTITPQMIKDVGYYDVANFGRWGGGHWDWSARACRAGYNRLENFERFPFDTDYVGMQIENYKPAGKREPIDWAVRWYYIKQPDRVFIDLPG